jgi:hypothetical protein
MVSRGGGSGSGSGSRWGKANGGELVRVFKSITVELYSIGSECSIATVETMT